MTNAASTQAAATVQQGSVVATDEPSALENHARRKVIALAGLGASGLALTPAGQRALALSGPNDVVDSYSALRDIDMSTSLETAMVVRGRSAVGDGGEGLFIYNPSSSAGDDDGTILKPTTGGGRWHRMFDGNRVNVLWFGAPDGSSSDTSWIQNALDAAKTYGEVFFPPGDYLIGSPLKIDFDTPGPNCSNGCFLRRLRLVGSNGVGRDADRTRLIWIGAPGSGPILQLDSRDCVVEHLQFIAMAQNAVSSAVKIGAVTAAPATMLVFRMCGFIGDLGGVNGSMNVGVEIATDNANQDHFRFEKCSFVDMASEGAGVKATGAGSQSRNHTFIDCYFGHPTGAGIAQRAAGIVMDGGSCQTYSCAFINLERAVYVGNLKHLSLFDSEVESVKRFLDTNYGGAAFGEAVPINIIGGHFSGFSNIDPNEDFDNMKPFDGHYIFYTFGGQLLVQSCEFSIGATYYEWFGIRAGKPNATASVIAIGNRFPNDAPFPFVNGPYRLISLGNQGLKDGTPVTRVPLDDVIGSIASSSVEHLVRIKASYDPSVPTEVSGIESLAGGASNNLRGRQQFGPGVTRRRVTLAFAEPTDRYYVVATLRGKMAGAAPVVYVTNQNTTGFALNLSQAPGPAQRVWVDWILIR